MERRQTRHDRTGVRMVTEGLWPMVAEPGPNFRWGVVLRKSKLKRRVNQYGQVELIAESMSIAPGSLGHRVGRGEDACHGGEQPEPARAERWLPVAAPVVGGQEDGRGVAAAARRAARGAVAGTQGRGAPAG